MAERLLCRFSVLGFLAALWVPLALSLGEQWRVHEQYRYGWAVPFLCLFLLAQRWQGMQAGRLPPRPGRTPLPQVERGAGAELRSQRYAAVWTLMIGMAVLVLPVRVVHEPNPLWRLTSLLWAMLAVGLTFGMVYLLGGRTRLREYAFPIAFFLVSVPWVTPVEARVVGALTRMNAAATVEVLGAAGVPAVQEGSVIEVGSGVVGMEEGCSGIRSVQATLMVSLFLGELYGLGLWRRVWCVGVGLGLALGFNLARTVFLTWVAAREGVAAAGGWHDPAGVVVAVGSMVGVYLVVLVMRPEALKERMDELIEGEFPEERAARLNEQVREGNVSVGGCSGDPFKWRLAPYRSGARRLVELLVADWCYVSLPQALGARAGEEARGSMGDAQERRSRWMLVFLAGWFVAVEAGTAFWYGALEGALPPPMAWRLTWPTENSSFAAGTMRRHVQEMLRCDVAMTATWVDAGHNRWLVNYLRWEPGRTAAHLARLHTPEACLPAAGWELQALPGLRRLGPLEPPLPFRVFRITDTLKRSGYVFYCRTGDRRDSETEEDEQPTRAQRLRAVCNGRGAQGMTVLEVVVWGMADEREAEEAVEWGLRRMIVR